MATRKIGNITYIKSTRIAFNDISKKEAQKHAKNGRNLGKKVRIIKNHKGKYDLWMNKH